MQSPETEAAPTIEPLKIEPLTIEPRWPVEGLPASASQDLEQAVIDLPRNSAAKFAMNSLLSVGRLLASTLVALVVPAYLAHRLPVKTYSAWVLLLQMSAYVGYLDFGVQTGIAKYVAEYDARGDAQGANDRASSGLAIMLVAAAIGISITFLLAYLVPHFFREMPSSLYSDVRISLLFVGISMSFGLVCSVPSAIFLGLQRYDIPMGLGLLNRILYTLVVLVAVFFRSSLALMGLGVAAVNVFTGLLQVVAWRRLAHHVRLTLRGLDRGVLNEMLKYCSVLAIWTIGMLCVSGLDVTIVGRYDFTETAYYSVATLPTNFIIAILGAALGPLLPTASALSSSRSPAEMGNLLARLTRYAVVMLGLSGLPMMVGGYWILTAWVGPDYARHTLLYLQVLVLANIIRNICLPYATLLAATGAQRVAVLGASAEALVNVVSSLLLVRHLGAVGVAYGTLLGSFVSVGMHLVINMRRTHAQFSISRTRLFAGSIARPLTMAVPSLLLAGRWWRTGPPTMSAAVWSAWGVSTLLLCWYVGLTAIDRKGLVGVLAVRLRRLWRKQHSARV